MAPSSLIRKRESSIYTTREEKRRTTEIAMEECHDKVPVVCGICAPTIEEQILHAKDAKELGVDGLFLMPPSGGADITLGLERGQVLVLFLRHDQGDPDCGRSACDHPRHRPGMRLRGVSESPPAPSAEICMAVPQIFGWKMVYTYEGWRVVAKTLRNLPRHVAVLPGRRPHLPRESCQ